MCGGARQPSGWADGSDLTSAAFPRRRRRDAAPVVADRRGADAGRERGAGPRRRCTDQPVRPRAALRRSRHGRRVVRRFRSGFDGDSEDRARGAEGDGRSSRRVDACRQRRRRGRRRRWIGACSSGAARQDGRPARRGDVLAVPLRQRLAVPRAPRRSHRSRGRGVLRQPAHRARPRRHDAPRGPHRAGAHRGRVEPRPDAEPAVHRGWHPTREHRAIGTACGAAAGGGSRARLQLDRTSRSWTT